MVRALTQQLIEEQQEHEREELRRQLQSRGNWG